MEIFPQHGKLTRRDAVTHNALKIAPWAGFAIATVPVPLLFFILYLTVATDAAFFMLLTLSSLAIGIPLAFIVALVLILYRRSWERRLRDRLASDGITVNELPFFTAELKSSEKSALRQIESVSGALADAYRETLAARLTATRLRATATRELVRVNGRLARAKHLQNADTESLVADLQGDVERLNSLKQQAERHLGQSEAQLQNIEATASRVTLQSDTNLAMERLGNATEQTPLALEAAKMEEVARQQVNSMIRESSDNDKMLGS